MPVGEFTFPILTSKGWGWLCCQSEPTIEDIEEVIATLEFRRERSRIWEERRLQKLHNEPLRFPPILYKEGEGCPEKP